MVHGDSLDCSDVMVKSAFKKKLSESEKQSLQVVQCSMGYKPCLGQLKYVGIILGHGRWPLCYNIRRMACLDCSEYVC